MGWGKKAARVAIAGLGCALLWSHAAAAAPPPNDDFADATVIAALPAALSASNIEATRETNEPRPGFASAGHSIWFSWEATFDGFVSAGTCGSAIQTDIGVYTGTAVGSLVEVGAGDGPYCADLRTERVTFEVLAGTTYAIVVDGDAFQGPEAPPAVSEGSIQFQLAATALPPNDDFANPTPVLGGIGEEPGGTRVYLATASGHNFSATKQAGEPDHAGEPGGASVWYAWTAPATGTARFSAFAHPSELTVAAYVGDDLASIAPVGGAIGQAVVAVEAGRTYRIAVDGRRSGAGEPVMAAHEFRVFMKLPPSAPGSGGPIPAGALKSVPRPLDAKPPRTRLTKWVTKARRRAVTFHFVSSEPGRFRCKLDRRRFAPCRSPKTYRGLKPGRHAFRVFAVDAAGNRDASAATARFTLPKPR